MYNDGFFSGMAVGFFTGIFLMVIFVLILVQGGSNEEVCEDTFKGDYSKTYDSKTGDAIYHCKRAR